MSLEKRRETEENRMEKELEGSSFRRLDFTPLENLEDKRKEREQSEIPIDTDLSAIKTV